MALCLTVEYKSTSSLLQVIIMGFPSTITPGHASFGIVQSSYLFLLRCLGESVLRCYLWLYSHSPVNETHGSMRQTQFLSSNCNEIPQTFFKFLRWICEHLNPNSLSKAMFRCSVLKQSNLVWDRNQSFIHWSHHQMLQNVLFFFLSASDM